MVLFDSDDKLLLWNQAYEALNAEVDDLLVPGITFEDMIREIARRGQVPQAMGRAEDWVQERLRTHRDGGDTQRLVNDGRWFLIRERPVPDFGGTIGLWFDITEQIWVEEEVRKSEAHLVDAFESVSAGLALFDAEERLVIFNQHFRDYYPNHADLLKPGVPFEHLARRVAESLYQAGRVTSIEEVLARRMAEFRRCQAGLEYLTVAGRWIVHSDFRTQLGGTLSVRTDITEQKNAEIALMQSEARFRDFAELSAEMLWETDRDLRFTFVSSTEKEFGAPPSALLGKRHEEILASGSNPAETDAESLAMQARRAYRNVERRSDLRDNTWISVSGKPMFAEDGSFLGYRGVTRNVTQRKEAEQRLQESRDLLASILNALPVGVTLVEPDGRLVFANRLEAETWGYDPEDAVGTSFYDTLPDNIAAKARAQNRQVMDTGESMPFYEDMIEKGGRRETLLIGKIPIKNRAHDVTRICTMTLDITSRVEAEMAHRETQERLQQSQKMETVGQLTGGIAHDFNNLMSIIIGNVELLEGKLGDDPESMAHIGMIKETIERGAALTHRLLTYSRKQTLAPAVVDLVELVGGLTDLLQRTLGATISLEVKSAPGLWLALVDPNQLENALINLAINARDAMPGGGSLVIEACNVTLDETYAANVEDFVAGNYVKIAVSDSGNGIATENLDRVMEPFYTTKEVGKGSGLGLSMVYGFAMQSRGHITIESEVGQGTTITLYLPQAEASVDRHRLAPTQSATLDAAPERSEPGPGSRKILVVDDNPDVRDISATILRHDGYEVIEAADGTEAVDAMAAHPDFDLLFVDLVLPGGLDGVDVAMEAVRRVPGLKVLYTSGFAAQTLLQDERLGAGAAVIRKPFTATDLLQKARTLLDRRA